MSQQRPANNAQPKPNMVDNVAERTVDVLVHDAPIEPPRFFESVTSPPYHIATPPPPPGFVLSPYQTPRFHTGGNVNDLLGDVQASPIMQTSFIQQNSVFMCNTRKVTQKPCCCQKSAPKPTITINGQPEVDKPKSYVTEKNIELNYDYPRSVPVNNGLNQRLGDEHHGTTTEVASTVVFVERRIPVKPKKFDFFFRSRSAPVGDNEEPIYATVNKLPKRLRKMELANLEKEVAYKTAEPDTSTRTDVTVKTDSEQSQAPHPDDDTSPSEREKSTAPQRPDTPKVKKRKRFSLTFKKRERKRREKKKDVTKNGVAKNGGPMHVETESERLIEPPETDKHKHCARHRPRNTMSSSSSGPRYKRDSYQVWFHPKHTRK